MSSRRWFLKTGATFGVGATAVADAAARDRDASGRRLDKWDLVADVIVVGAGASGLCAAIAARDQGASVLLLEQNHDIGGHAMLSGGLVSLGGGTSLQKKYGIADSADQVYLDHTDSKNPTYRYSDRDLVRAWADENAPTLEFLLENGVRFIDEAPRNFGGSVPRVFRCQLFSNDLSETINGQHGSGLVRPLEKSARAKGIKFLLDHTLVRIVREEPLSGRVQGVVAVSQGKPLRARARKGVVIATGGHTSNVEFRRTFDPRLTEEYQVAGEPWTRQTGDGELLAMAVGASLWATGGQTTESGASITKTRHIGCRYGYRNLKWKPGSPVFDRVGASGLTVDNWRDLILVNQVGQRFWNEDDESFAFLNACLARNDRSGGDGRTANGGGPIWAIFDADAVTRQKWDPSPPHVDLNGWFFSAATLEELARKITNPYQRQAMDPSALEQTVSKYNAFVDGGKDQEFGRLPPLFKIQKPPFYAAWSTPILHDTLAGLRINTRCEVIDLRGQAIPGLYCAGESAGGFSLHGLPRVTVFGRMAGREVAGSSIHAAQDIGGRSDLYTR